MSRSLAIQHPTQTRFRPPIFLNVPFEDKDEVKALGAWWSVPKRAWYVPSNADVTRFSKWNTIDFENESGSILTPSTVNRSRIALFVDMIPRSAFFSNLRSEITATEWEAVKKKTAHPAGNCCEACDQKGEKWPVECHERWIYDESAKIQILDRTVAFCPPCHEATHYGLAGINGRSEHAQSQLMKVTGMNRIQVQQHIRNATTDWRRRSSMQWTLDARWLLDFIPLSAVTKTKILDHANKLIERELPSIELHEQSTHQRERQRGP